MIASELRTSFARSCAQSRSSIARQPIRPLRRHASGLGAPGASKKPMLTTRNFVIIGAGVGGVVLLAAMGGAFAGLSQRESDFAQKKKAAGMATGKSVDYQAVYNQIAEALEEDAADYDDGSYGPVLIRLAWHCSGTYDKNSGNGGSNGATMRFAPEANHGANAGLLHARNKLEPIRQKFPDISYSDLWTLAGVVAVQEMGGPTVPWRPGREDHPDESHCTPDGRLPDGDKGADHIRKMCASAAVEFADSHSFYKMGFNDQEIVALSGAHAVGRCHTDRSGFDGPWSFSPVTFSNEKWNKRAWEGPLQYQDKGSKSLMMLETDMALVKDKVFRPIAEKYAKDEALFFKDFSAAFARLIELGVPEKNFSSAPLRLKSTSELAA